MFESVMALSQFTTVLWTCAGEIRSRHGNDFWYAPPSNMFRCADGWVYVNVTPEFWDVFATCIDRPELVLDARFDTNVHRMVNHEALYEIVAEAFAPLLRKECIARATAHRFPCGELLSLDETLNDPHLAARDFWQQVEGAGGPIRSPRRAWRMDEGAPPPLVLSDWERPRG